LRKARGFGYVADRANLVREKPVSQKWAIAGENPMLWTRRAAMTGCCALAGLAALPARAEAYPARPIKMIVPYPAGGTIDLLGRMVADQLRRGLNATVVVENKPGAATLLGAELVARSEADGYTLLTATSTTLSINKSLYRKLPYDPIEDFAPIAPVTRVPFALIVNSSLPASLTEFTAYAKSNPGLAYGSAGNGSPQHLGAEMLRAALGINVRHVSYRSSVAALLDVIAGRTAFMISDLQLTLPQIREGKVRALGVTTPQRVAAAPDIPTLAETGLDGFELVAWVGVVAPARVPQPIIEQLATQIDRLTSDPSTVERFTRLALEPVSGSTPDRFKSFVKAEVDRWGVIVRNSGAEPE
jgi:tripartite-type tricarboxylate transporter receptor subunit TctC